MFSTRQRGRKSSPLSQPVPPQSGRPMVTNDTRQAELEYQRFQEAWENSDVARTLNVLNRLGEPIDYRQLNDAPNFLNLSAPKPAFLGLRRARKDAYEKSKAKFESKEKLSAIPERGAKGIAAAGRYLGTLTASEIAEVDSNVGSNLTITERQIRSRFAFDENNFNGADDTSSKSALDFEAPPSYTSEDHNDAKKHKCAQRKLHVIIGAIVALVIIGVVISGVAIHFATQKEEDLVQYQLSLRLEAIDMNEVLKQKDSTAFQSLQKDICDMISSLVTDTKGCQLDRCIAGSVITTFTLSFLKSVRDDFESASVNQLYINHVITMVTNALSAPDPSQTVSTFLSKYGPNQDSFMEARFTTTPLVTVVTASPTAATSSLTTVGTIATTGGAMPTTAVEPTTSTSATLTTTAAPATAAPTTSPTAALTTTVPITTAIHPTTVAPTTVPETTAVPTTHVPTTVAPTTAAPTTAAPTTVAPTTAVPTTVAPTTVATTTAAPTTVATTTVAPTTAAPTTAPTTTVPTTAIPTTAVSTTAIPTTAVSTTISTTVAPTTAAPTTHVPTTAATTTAPTTTVPTSGTTAATPVPTTTTAAANTLTPSTAAPTTPTAVTPAPETSTPAPVTTTAPPTPPPTSTAAATTASATTAAPPPAAVAMNTEQPDNSGSSDSTERSGTHPPSTVPTSTVSVTATVDVDNNNVTDSNVTAAV